MEKNRLSILPKHLQAEIKRHITYLKKAMDKLEKELDKLIA
ncbi:MAG TPA: IS110 family transposase, partial [Leucothrix sp.]|nr:IS110 family transposase [Leucothrix sp.]